jgi:hypothetical protein
VAVADELGLPTDSAALEVGRGLRGRVCLCHHCVGFVRGLCTAAVRPLCARAKPSSLLPPLVNYVFYWDLRSRRALCAGLLVVGVPHHSP